MQEMKEAWVRFLGREGPLEKGVATHSSFLPEKSHGQRSLVGYSPWGQAKSQTRLSDLTHMHVLFFQSGVIFLTLQVSVTTVRKIELFFSFGRTMYVGS